MSTVKPKKLDKNRNNYRFYFKNINRKYQTFFKRYNINTL